MLYKFVHSDYSFGCDFSSYLRFPRYILVFSVLILFLY